jgi:hypothetical protein
LLFLLLFWRLRCGIIADFVVVESHSATSTRRNPITHWRNAIFQKNDIQTVYLLCREHVLPAAAAAAPAAAAAAAKLPPVQIPYVVLWSL